MHYLSPAIRRYWVLCLKHLSSLANNNNKKNHNNTNNKSKNLLMVFVQGE